MAFIFREEAARGDPVEGYERVRARDLSLVRNVNIHHECPTVGDARFELNRVEERRAGLRLRHTHNWCRARPLEARHARKAKSSEEPGHGGKADDQKSSRVRVPISLTPHLYMVLRSETLRLR